MAEAMSGDDQKVDQPPRSTHAGELYRFQAAGWQKFPGYVFLTVIFIVFIVFGVELLGGSGGVSQSTPGGVVVIVAGILMPYAVWRGLAVRVVVTEQGLKLRNHVRNYHLSWDEIDGYEAAGHHYLRLADGDRIRLYGLAEGPLGASARAARNAARLNSEIERHKQAPAADPVGAMPRTPS